MRPLSFTIIASINENGNYRQASLTISQDKLDELRQEYIDCSPWTPSRYYFDKDAPYNSGLLGPAADSQKHDYWHVLYQLNGYAANSNSIFYGECGGSIIFSSGYRCPEGNFSVGGSYGSNHMYGRAFDFQQQEGTSNYEYYQIWQSAKEAGASDAYLHTISGYDDWHPTYPSDATYNRGHAQWQ
ncbi:MAG: D-Ala-D-Ala carboxypeptidase family metallohydrolase [Candidatus Aminicenantes bacterium]|nr:D-Ala-D-Ala carboxypeptidase family metallohydrolase [Candidatus Aminicenantes bacterium]